MMMRSVAALVLDRAMPRFSSHEFHAVAMPEVRCNVMQAVEELTWAEVPGFHRLIRLAAMGTRKFPKEGRVLSLLLDGPYEIVHRSPRELVIVGVLPLSPEFAMPDLGDDPIETYRRLAQPGMVKVAANFLVRDGVLSTETRNQPIGAKARAIFAVYWASIRLGSGLIRRSWLKGVRSRAITIDTDSCSE